MLSYFLHKIDVHSQSDHTSNTNTKTGFGQLFILSMAVKIQRPILTTIHIA
jgi:hypothetical protein